MKIEYIVEEDYIFEYLEKRNLVKQYKKVKLNILSGNFTGNRLKYRKPKTDEVLYFHINKQYRVFCHLENNTLVVFEINNHQ